MKKKLVFIHGFGGLSFESRPLKRYFEKKDVDCYEFKYKKCFGQVSLGKIAEGLDDFVKKIKGEFVLVGLSQGGYNWFILAGIFRGKEKMQRNSNCLFSFSWKLFILSFVFKRSKGIKAKKQIFI